MISKLICSAALTVFVALLACGGEEPAESLAETPVSRAAEAPTASARPSPKPEPTATPEPTVAPVPTATSVRKPTATSEPTATAQVPDRATDTGAIVTLRLDDPLAIASELSESELTCLAGVAEIGRLLEIFAAPELASTEEQTQLLGCLEDETLLRIFLTEVIEHSGPLSVDTSACIRTGMEGVDLPTVMLSGIAGDEEAAMGGSMSAFILTLMCLNEDEWEGAAAGLGFPPEERENLQCLLDELGGPEGFAETLGEGDEGSFFALFGAAMGCGVQIEGGPGG